MRDDVTFRVLVSHQYHRSAAIMIRRWCPKLLLFVFYLYSLRFATLHASDSGSGPACQECPNGTFANQSNENCSKCEGGYCNSIDYCSLCLPGTHTEHSGMSICEPCETGSVCNTTGCDRCTKCLAGTAAKNSRVCEPCSIGSYSDVDGSTVCKECSPGLICNITGCDQCTKCLAGTAAKNSSVCDPCSAGSYSNVDGSTVCKECSPGLICNKTGCTHCLPCSAGHQPQAGSSLYSCEPCPPGSYRRNNAGPHLFCVRCQPGWYQVKEGQISCTICPEGHFCPDSTSGPHKCPEGTNCPQGSTQPILCHNLYSYSSEARACVPQSSFYIMIVSVIAIFILIVVLVAMAAYWNMCRKKQMKEEKVPLVIKKQPVKNPMYFGH